MIDPELLYRAVESAQHGIYVTDATGKIEYGNPGFADITGYTVSELLGQPMSILKSGQMPSDYYRRLWQTLSAGERWEEEITNQRKDGSLYAAHQIISPVTDADGRVQRYVGIQRDITREREIQHDLATALLEFNAIFSNTQDAMFLVDVTDDPQRPFLFRKLSTSHELLTFLCTDQVRGRTPQETVGAEQGAVISAHYQRCVDVKHVISYEEELDLPAGHRVWSTQLSPVWREDRIVQIVGSSRDVTERKRMEEDLRYLSEIDSLTGIPNRRKTTEELERELARAHRHGSALSIILADLDHFKAINDDLGHEAGDNALRGVASTLQATVRPTDRIGRWGGEEFLIVLPETDGPGARTAAERIRAAVEASRAIPHRHITVSLGIASLGPVRTANPRALVHTVDSLVRIADEELYRAKESGRNRISG